MMTKENMYKNWLTKFYRQVPTCTVSYILLQRDYLKQVKTTETAPWDLIKGDCNHFIEFKVTVIKGINFQDFVL